MQLVDPLVLTLVYIFNQPFEYSFYSCSTVLVVPNIWGCILTLDLKNTKDLS